MSVRHALLALLSEGPKYGLQLREEFEANTGQVWPLNVGQVYTTLQRLERDGLVAAFDTALEKNVPGNVFSYSQPIELRVQELIAGVRSDLAVTLFGDDLDQLRRTGEVLARVVARVPGAADVL